MNIRAIIITPTDIVGNGFEGTERGVADRIGRLIEDTAEKSPRFAICTIAPPEAKNLIDSYAITIFKWKTAELDGMKVDFDWRDMLVLKEKIGGNW